MMCFLEASAPAPTIWIVRVERQTLQLVSRKYFKVSKSWTDCLFRKHPGAHHPVVSREANFRDDMVPVLSQKRAVTR
jgi:hypothetical protein